MAGLSGQAKHFARYAVWRLTRADVSSSNNVLIVAHRRGGSTLLRDAIWSQSGFDYVDQPFDPGQPGSRAAARFLGPGAIGDFGTDVNPELDQYVEQILRGRRYVRSQWDIRDPRFHWRVNRLVIKLVNGVGALRYWLDRPCVIGLTLLRHPLAIARSTAAAGWPPNGEHFLSNPRYRERYLDSSTINQVRDLLADPDPCVRHIASWLLATIPALEGSPRPSAVVTYEDLVGDPGATFDAISADLGLGDRSSFVRSISIPTRTATDRSAAGVRLSGPALRSRLEPASPAQQRAIGVAQQRLGAAWPWPEEPGS